MIHPRASCPAPTIAESRHHQRKGDNREEDSKRPSLHARTLLLRSCKGMPENQGESCPPRGVAQWQSTGLPNLGLQVRVLPPQLGDSEGLSKEVSPNRKPQQQREGRPPERAADLIVCDVGCSLSEL